MQKSNSLLIFAPEMHWAHVRLMQEMPLWQGCDDRQFLTE